MADQGCSCHCCGTPMPGWLEFRDRAVDTMNKLQKTGIVVSLKDVKPLETRINMNDMLAVQIYELKHPELYMGAVKPKELDLSDAEQCGYQMYGFDWAMQRDPSVNQLAKRLRGDE